MLLWVKKQQANGRLLEESVLLARFDQLKSLLEKNVMMKILKSSSSQGQVGYLSPRAGMLIITPISDARAAGP
jgi:hypothetical protein